MSRPLCIAAVFCLTLVACGGPSSEDAVFDEYCDTLNQIAETKASVTDEASFATAGPRCLELYEKLDALDVEFDHLDQSELEELIQLYERVNDADRKVLDVPDDEQDHLEGWELIKSAENRLQVYERGGDAELKVLQLQGLLDGVSGR